MLICDSNCRILACDARYPGSVHDAAIFRTSDIRRNLRNEFANGDTTSHLIGDSGYALEPWLFTPFQIVEEGTPEARFNRVLTSTRNVIERTKFVLSIIPFNGILKSRFRCLLKHRTLHYHPAKAAYIIYTACILHNMATAAHLEMNYDDIVHEDNDLNNDNVANNQNIPNTLEAGRAARELYIRINM